MKAFDISCFLGNWPFRKLYKNNIDDLVKVHEENHITGGCISSLDSIFYNDPFEGDDDLHRLIEGSEYKHILTINPCLPGFKEDIERACNEFSIKGVRIYPGYHGYKLDSNEVNFLCSILCEKSIPLFITLRLEDERLNYLCSPQSINSSDISAFLLNHKDLKIVLSNIRYNELLDIKETINSSESIYFDTTGLKDRLFIIEKLLIHFSVDKILFGSLHPLYCLKSTILLIEKADIPEEYKAKILYENAVKLLMETP